MSTLALQQTHQKHTKLQDPQWGTLGRNEISIVGTTCSTAAYLANHLIKQLSPQYNLVFADSEHSAQEEDVIPSRIQGMRYTESEPSQQIYLNPKKNEYQVKSLFNEQDLLLLNGNHFSAATQIAVVDPRKSLKQTQEQLTDVKVVILREQAEGIPDEARETIDNFSSIPIFHVSEINKIAKELKQFIRERVPPLWGLVLAGGKSTRMHTDKTVLEYHDKPQRSHLYGLLNTYTEDVFISCRAGQQHEIPSKFNVITDTFLEMGPMGALLSAFRKYPNRAWLSVACDLPLLSPQSLENLAANRNPSKIATAFNNPDSSFPEPLITIWEPKSYPVLLHYLGLGYSCPRKVLINSDIELLEAPDPHELKNVNRPEEYEQAKQILATGS